MEGNVTQRINGAAYVRTLHGALVHFSFVVLCKSSIRRKWKKSALYYYVSVRERESVMSFGYYASARTLLSHCFVVERKARASGRVVWARMALSQNWRSPLVRKKIGNKFVFWMWRTIYSLFRTDCDVLRKEKWNTKYFVDHLSLQSVKCFTPGDKNLLPNKIWRWKRGNFDITSNTFINSWLL